MNFKEWVGRNLDLSNCNDKSYEYDMAEQGWNAAKEEILKIIFLNIKQNGKKTIDIEKTVTEIEKL